jgi:membrane protease YdiL (CAAX protease family)
MRKIFTHYHSLNKVGLWLSVLCTIHCLAMPFLMTALPFLSGSFLSEKSEIYMIGVSAILAIFLLIKDYRNHQNSLPLILLSVAICFNFAGLFLAKGIYEILFNVIGALMMASAYYINWNSHNRACHSHSH